MKLGFVIFEGMTTLDFMGVYDPVTRLKTMGFLPDLRWEVCALSSEVADITGLRLLPTRVGGSLHDFDMVIVPGGRGSRTLMHDPEFLEWLRSARPCRYKVSVCAGALLLGAAGFLVGKRATTHPNAFKELEPFCASVVEDRVVDEGNVITARGVTAAIDLGLYLCEKLAGLEVKERIRRQMDYEGAAGTVRGGRTGG